METGAQGTTLEQPAIVERVARIVSSVRGTKPDYTGLAAELAPAIPFDVFGVVLLRHDRQAVRVTVCRREGDAWVALYHQHPFEGSKVEQVLRHPVMLARNYPAGLDGPPAEMGDALSGYPHLRATLIVPLTVGERVLGTLEFGSVQLHTYSDEALRRVIEAVARVLATTIEGVQVGGNVEIQDRQRQALKSVSSALTSTMDLPTIFDRIVAGVAEALHVASAIVTLDRERNCLQLEAQSGMDPLILSELISNAGVLTDKCIIGNTLRHRQPHFSNDIAVDTRFPISHLFYTALGMHSIFVYPLVTGTTIYGALVLCSPEAGGFTPLKVDILSLFASQATIAIHNGMLLESARQRRRFQEIIEQLERTQQKAELDDYALFELVRGQAERTFGLSFSSLLRFISDHLLTRGERTLQEIFHAVDEERSASTSQEQVELRAQEERVALLTQTAEEALERASILSELSRLSQLNERVPGQMTDAWFALDLSGHCIYMNLPAEVLTGIRMHAGDSPLEEVFAALLPRTRNAAELLVYLQDFAQEQTQRVELRCIIAAEPLLSRRPEDFDGGWSPLLPESAPSDRHCLFTRYPVFDQQGQLKAYILHVRDITEQVRDEKNKSVLLSSVSHDLRTPLTTIKAAVTGLLQSDVEWDEEIRQEFLEEIDAETDHLTILVNALIEMSRIEMGALMLEKEWCDIVEIFYGARSHAERLLGKRTVCTRFQPNLPLVQVDYVQLERVFYNLLANAARHSPDHGDITVTLDVVDGLLRGQVIDQGNGVPEEERERIFKTFYSLDSQGNGLGLAICRGIVEAHQGRIWVEAGPERQEGACFVFTVPVYARSGTPGASAPAQTAAEEP
ncbi:MAG: ATP-binding protein [Ktedonobacteraceae bacterium]